MHLGLVTPTAVKMIWAVLMEGDGVRNGRGPVEEDAGVTGYMG